MAGDACIACPLRAQQDIVEGKRWKAVHGDAVIALRDMADESIEMIVTDPPYGTGANDVSSRLLISSKKYSNSSAPLPDIAGDSILPDGWQEMIRTVAHQCLRVAVPGAYALMFCDWRSYPMLLRITSSIGWLPRGLIVWDKGRGARPNRNGFRAQTEFVLWLRKGRMRQLGGEPVYLDGVFRFASPVRRHHLTEKPVALLKELLRIARPGEHILDPFQGSGTTGVVAIQLGLRYTGVEVVREYHDIAVQRLRAAEGCP